MKVVKQGKRNSVSRFFRSKGDKDKIAVWRYDLIRILQVFNVRSAGSIGSHSLTSMQTELIINTNMMVADMHRNALTGQEGASGRNDSVCVTYDPPKVRMLTVI